MKRLTQLTLSEQLLVTVIAKLIKTDPDFVKEIEHEAGEEVMHYAEYYANLDS